MYDVTMTSFLCFRQRNGLKVKKVWKGNWGFETQFQIAQVYSSMKTGVIAKWN